MAATELRLNVVLVCSDAAEMDVTVHGRMLRRLMQYTTTATTADNYSDTAALIVSDEVQARVAHEMQDVLEVMAIRDHNAPIPARLRDTINGVHNNNKRPSLLHGRSATAVVMLDETNNNTTTSVPVNEQDSSHGEASKADGHTTTAAGKKSRGSVMNNAAAASNAVASPMAAGRRRASMASATLQSAVDEEKEKAALVQMYLPHCECVTVAASVTAHMSTLLQCAQGHYARWKTNTCNSTTIDEGCRYGGQVNNATNTATHSLPTRVVFVYELPNEAALVQAAEEDMAELPNDDIEARTSCAQTHAMAFRRALKHSVLTALSQVSSPVTAGQDKHVNEISEHELLVVWCVRHVMLLQALLTSAEPDESSCSINSTHVLNEVNTMSIMTGNASSGTAIGTAARKSMQSSPMKGKGANDESSSNKATRASSASRSNGPAAASRKGNTRQVVGTTGILTAEKDMSDMAGASHSGNSIQPSHLCTSTAATVQYTISAIAPRMLLYITAEEENDDEDDSAEEGYVRGRSSSATSHRRTSGSDGHTTNTTNSAVSNAANKSTSARSEGKRGNANTSGKKSNSAAAAHRTADNNNSSSGKKTRSGGKSASSPTTSGSNATRNFDAFAEGHHSNGMRGEDDEAGHREVNNDEDQTNSAERNDAEWEKMAYQSCTTFEECVDVLRRWQKRRGRLLAQRYAALYPAWADIRYDPARFRQWLSETLRSSSSSQASPLQEFPFSHTREGEHVRRSRSASLARDMVSVTTGPLASLLETMIVEDYYTALTQYAAAILNSSVAGGASGRTIFNGCVTDTWGHTSCEPVWCLVSAAQPLLPQPVLVQQGEAAPQQQTTIMQQAHSDSNATSIVPAMPIARCCNASLSVALRGLQSLLACLAAYNTWRGTKYVTTLPNNVNNDSTGGTMQKYNNNALQAPPIDTLRRRCRDALLACAGLRTPKSHISFSNTLWSDNDDGVGEVHSVGEVVRRLCAQATRNNLQRDMPQCLVQPCDDEAAIVLAGIGPSLLVSHDTKSNDLQEEKRNSTCASDEDTLRLRRYFGEGHSPFQTWLAHGDQPYYYNSTHHNSTMLGEGHEHTVHFADQSESTAAATAHHGSHEIQQENVNAVSPRLSSARGGRENSASVDEARKTGAQQRPSSRRTASPLTERLSGPALTSLSLSAPSAAMTRALLQPERLCVLPVTERRHKSSTQSDEVSALDAMLRETLLQSTGIALPHKDEQLKDIKDVGVECEMSGCGVLSVRNKARRAAVEEAVEDVTAALHAMQHHSHSDNNMSKDEEVTALHILHPLLVNTATDTAASAATTVTKKSTATSRTIMGKDMTATDTSSGMTSTTKGNNNHHTVTTTQSRGRSAQVRRCTDRERQHVLRHVLLNTIASACGVLAEHTSECLTQSTLHSNTTSVNEKESELYTLHRLVEEPLSAHEAWRRLLAYRQRYGAHNCAFVCYTHTQEAHNAALATHDVRRLWLVGTKGNANTLRCDATHETLTAQRRRRHRVWLHAIHGLPPLTTFLILQRWLAETEDTTTTTTTANSNDSVPVVSASGEVSSRAVMRALLTRYLTQPVIQRCSTHTHTTPSHTHTMTEAHEGDPLHCVPHTMTSQLTPQLYVPRFVLESRETLYPHCDALIELTTTACGRVCQYIKSREVMAALHYSRAAMPSTLTTSSTTVHEAGSERDYAAYLSIRFDEDDVLFTCASCQGDTTNKNDLKKNSEGTAGVLHAMRSGRRKAPPRDTESVASTTSTNAGGAGGGRGRRTANPTSNTANNNMNVGQKSGNERRRRGSLQQNIQGTNEAKTTTISTSTAPSNNATAATSPVCLPLMNAALTPLDAQGRVRLWNTTTTPTTTAKRAAQSRSRRTSTVSGTNTATGNAAALPFDQRIKPLNVWVTSKDCVLSVPDVGTAAHGQSPYVQLTYRRAPSLHPLCPSNNNYNTMPRQPTCELIYCVHDYAGVDSILRPSLEQEQSRIVRLESGVVVRSFVGSTHGLEQRFYPDGTILTRYRQGQRASTTSESVKQAGMYIDTLTMPSGTRYVRRVSDAHSGAVKTSKSHESISKSGFVRLVQSSKRKNSTSPTTMTTTNSEEWNLAHRVHGVESYDVGEHCRMWCRQDGLRCVTYERVLLGTQHSNEKGKMSEDVLRVVVHADGTSLVTLLQPNLTSSESKNATEPSGKKAEEDSQWVMSPVVHALLRECALVQRACPGYRVRWLVESPYAPRLFLLAPIEQQEEEKDLHEQRVANTNISGSNINKPHGAFYAVFGDGSVLARHAITSPHHPVQNEENKDINELCGAMRTRFTRPTQTTVHVLHESNLVLLEPSEVLARYRTQPAAGAVQEGTVVFDLGLGGVRLVDYVRRVFTVSNIFASGAPSIVKSTLGNAASQAASRRGSRHDNTTVNMNTESGFVTQDTASSNAVIAGAAKPRTGSAHMAMEGHALAASEAVQQQQVMNKRAPQETSTSHMRDGAEGDKTTVQIHTESHTWGSLLRELVGEHYTTHRLPQAQQSAWQAAQDAQRTRIATAARTGRCLPLLERLRALAEPIITEYELLRVDHLHRLEHEDNVPYTTTTDPSSLMKSSATMQMTDSTQGSSEKTETRVTHGAADIVPSRPLCIPPLYIAELATQHTTTIKTNNMNTSFVQLVDEASLREACRNAQYVAESVAAGEPHIVQHTLCGSLEHMPSSRNHNATCHGEGELNGSTCNPIWKAVEEDEEEEEEDGSVVGAMRFHCGSMQPVTAAQLLVTQTGTNNTKSEDESCKGVGRGLSSFACEAAVRQNGSRWLPAALQPPRRFLAKQAATHVLTIHQTPLTFTNFSKDVQQKQQRVFLRYTGLDRSVTQALVRSAVQDDMERSQALRCNRARMQM